MDKNTAQTKILTFLMTGGKYDYAVIASKLAAYDPVLFLQMSGCESSMPWVKEVRNFMLNSQKVAAIKCVRGEFGIGLYEAKAIVDAYQADGDIAEPSRWDANMHDILHRLRFA